MQIRPEITCTITDDVTTLLGLCIARVNQLEGTTKKEAFIYNRYIAVIDIKEDVANILIVDQPQRGFISYPRSGTLKTAPIPGTDKNMTPTYMIVNTGNGFNIDEAGVIVDLGAGGLVAYPVDQAYAGNSWVFLDNGDSTWNVKGGAKDYYGNVDWKGPATSDPTKRKILSYFGNPSRYWPIGQFISVPNLTTIDHTIESLTGDYSYTTVFRPYVFEAGTIKAIMPPLYAPMNSSIQRAQVLGAAYRESDEKLVCIVKTCYNTYPRAKAVGEMVSTWQVFNGDTLVLNFLEDKAKATEFAATSNEYTLKEVPDPGRGYWVEVLLEKAGDVEGGWTRLLRIPQDMPNTNWFFSENGTQAVTVMYGKLHLITISGTSATYTTQELGEFKNTIKTTKVMKQEENPGEPGGGFANVFRVGIESGDWILKTENTNKYTSIKSGTRILCADFKGNELVKLTSTLSGTEEYNYYRLFGTKWGETAIPPLQWDDSTRIPTIRIDVDPFDEFGTPLGHWCVGLGGVCKPRVTLMGLGSATIENQNCAEFNGCEINSKQTLTLSAEVEDLAGGRKATTTKTYTIIPRNLVGPWTTIFQSSCAGGTQTAYKFDGKWKRITYGVSNIPVNAVIGSLSELDSERIIQKQMCQNGFTQPTYWMNIVPSVIGKYFNSPTGLRRCNHGGYGGWLSDCESDGSWDKYEWIAPHVVEARSTNWQCYYDWYTCKPGGFTFSYLKYSFDDPICNDFASDSYLEGLVDLNGNPVTITETTYKVKVFRVEEPC